MFVFDDADPKTVDVEITLKGGSFTLTLTHPSLEARTIDDAQAYEHYVSTGQRNAEAYKAKFFNRLSSVTGWNGVSDASGKPLEFSLIRLKRLLGKNPAIVEQIVPHLNKLFQVEDGSVGESVASPGDSPQEPTVEDVQQSKPI